MWKLTPKHRVRVWQHGGLAREQGSMGTQPEPKPELSGKCKSIVNNIKIYIVTHLHDIAVSLLMLLMQLLCLLNIFFLVS